MELQYLQLYQRYASLQVLFKIFAQICSVVIYKEMFKILQTSVSQKIFQQQRAANRFKVLKIYISLKVTVHIQDRRLWSGKALDAQGFEWKSNCTNIHMISNIKYTAIYIYIYIYSKTWPGSLLHIQQRRIQNPFQRLNKKVISLEVTIFTKISIFDV